MKIIREFRNGLLKRREICAAVEAESNPGFEKSKKDIASHFKVDENFLVIKKLGSNFGSHNFLIEALIYDSVDDKNKFERKEKVKADKKEASKK